MPSFIFIAKKINTSDSSGLTRIIVKLGIVALAVCISVLLLASSFIAGFQREITRKVFNFWGHIHITHVESDRSMDAVPLLRGDNYLANIKNISQVEYLDENGNLTHSVGGVKSIDAFIHYPGILSRKTEFDGVICKGIDHLYNWDLFNEYLLEGKGFELDTSKAYGNMCVISSILSSRLGLKLGDKAILHFILDGKEVKKRVEVSGIYNTGLQEYDEKFILVDMRLLQNVLKWDENQVSGFSVSLDDIADLNTINEYIYIEQIPSDQYSETVQSKFPGIFEWLEIQKLNEWVLFIIMMIVAFFNLSTVMIIMIVDRVKMIGILKALGARTWVVIQVFIAIMARIILKGFLIGNLLALAIGWLQHRFHLIKLNQADYYLSYAPVDFDLTKILLINLFAFVVILLFMLIPAMMIGGMKPMRVLRFS